MAYDPIQSTKWCRFDRYRIEKGAIRPAKGALVTIYDPWEIFESVKGERRTVNSLWGEFVELARRVKEASVEPSHFGSYLPSRDGAVLIRDWSNKYGLLGLLPSTAVEIVLPATWELSGKGGHPTPTAICMQQQTHSRVAAYWDTMCRSIGKHGRGLVWPPPNSELGTLVPKSEWTSSIRSPCCMGRS